MKRVISLVAVLAACPATADVQQIQYSYDDSKAEYAIVSFVEAGSAVQATVRRTGAYFTNYTKLELDCANRNVRHMGMYNSVEGVEKAEFDQMQGRITRFDRRRSGKGTVQGHDPDRFTDRRIANRRFVGRPELNLTSQASALHS
jgi:hypothetical protein